MNVRPWDPGDIPAMTDLLATLGYPIDAATVAERLGLLGADEPVLVAVDAGVPIGLVALRLDNHLAEGRAVEIVAFVVDPKHRRRGIGSALVAAAGEWAAAADRDVLRLRSNVVRDDAHRFYEDLGFHPVKRSTVFEIRISAD